MLRQNVGNSPIRSMLASICLRRSKSALDLPGRTDRIHKVNFAAEEGTYYNSMSAYVTGCLQEKAEHPILGTYANVLAKINALRQICNLGTLYQGQLPAPIGVGNPPATPQFLFEGMLSAGLAICIACSSDLDKGDESAAVGINCGDVIVTGQPRLSTCGEVICASCSLCWDTFDSLEGPACQHQPSCEFVAVNMSTSFAAPTHVPEGQLPVKMRALQKDLLALPKKDKRYLFIIYVQTCDF